ncbi:MAG: ATPase [Chromatiales bacterium]
MKLTLEEFDQWEHKAVTLLGMSGVGKTYLSNTLRQADWFHFSGDYRIGTRYLDEAIIDNIKVQAMQVPFLRDLLRSDSIHIGNNITVDHLKPVSTFLGKVGDPEKMGLPLDEFKRRQRLHYEAEIATMLDVHEFIRKSQDIYGYTHFINDAGGSLCELEDESVFEALSADTMFIYIKATQQNEEDVIRRARLDPKPLYFREAFLDEHLEIYLRDNDLEYVAMIDPDDFARWVFPRLFYERIPRYENLARKYGYTVSSEDVARVRNEADFIDLLRSVIERGY